MKKELKPKVNGRKLNKSKKGKTWAEMTNEEKSQFYLDIFANPSGYANPSKPFYC